MKGRAFMVKIVWPASMFSYFALLPMAFIPSNAAAQAAVEYGGIIGCKPPPRSPEVLKNTDRMTKPGTSRSSVQRKKKPIQAKAAGRTGEPLIIEKRDAGYERIQ
jgi:hypothetical protein